MRKLPTALVLLISGVYAVESRADCHAPTAPIGLPEPAKATEPEILAAQQSVKQYLSQMETVLKCLADQHMDQQRDSAIDDMQKVATKFNSILHAYRARQAT